MEGDWPPNTTAKAILQALQQAIAHPPKTPSLVVLVNGNPLPEGIGDIAAIPRTARQTLVVDPDGHRSYCSVFVYDLNHPNVGRYLNQGD